MLKIIVKTTIFLRLKKVTKIRVDLTFEPGSLHEHVRPKATAIPGKLENILPLTQREGPAKKPDLEL